MRTSGSKGPRYVACSCSSLLTKLMHSSSQVNIEHQMLGRAGNAMEGRDNDSGDSSAGSLTKQDKELEDRKAADLA